MATKRKSFSKPANKTNNTKKGSIIRQQITLNGLLALGYPYAEYFVKPKQLLHKIRQYKPKISNVGFTYLYKTEVPEIKDHRFRGKYYSVDISLRDYNNLDIIVDYYTERSRMKCTKPNKPSPFTIMTTPDGLLEFALKYLIKRNKAITNPAIRDAIYRYPGIYICSGESVLFYKGLISILFGPDYNYTRLNMMDGAIGYGQRLMSAIMLKCNYIGIDPNTETLAGCRRMIKDLAPTNRAYLAYPEGLPASVHINKVRPATQDIVFFSPPSFDEEIYGEHVGQSILLFPTFDVWLDKFLKPSLDILVSKLKVTGYLVIQSRKIKYIFNHLINSAGLEFRGVIARRTYSDKYKPNHIFVKSGTK